MMLKTLPLALLFASAAALADPGSVTRATTLKDKPFLDAATTAQLDSGSIVDIQKRQGAWMQVKTKEGKTGWVKLLNIRSGASATGGGWLATTGNVLATGTKVATTGSSGNTVTTGVKGLSAEQIKNAKADPAELTRLQSYGISGSEAQQFAKQAKLTAQKVAAIDVAKD